MQTTEAQNLAFSEQEFFCDQASQVYESCIAALERRDFATSDKLRAQHRHLARMARLAGDDFKRLT